MTTTIRHTGAHAQHPDRAQGLPRTITRLVRQLASRDRGAVTRIASLAGVDRTTVAHWLGDEGRTYHVPADALAHVCDALDTIAPLQAIADELGYDVVPRPASASVASVRRGVGAIMRDVGALSIALEEALEDGTLAEAERVEFDALLTAAIESAKATRARIAGTR